MRIDVADYVKQNLQIINILFLSNYCTNLKKMYRILNTFLKIKKKIIDKLIKN